MCIVSNCPYLVFVHGSGVFVDWFVAYFCRFWMSLVFCVTAAMICCHCRCCFCCNRWCCCCCCCCYCPSLSFAATIGLFQAQFCSNAAQHSVPPWRSIQFSIRLRLFSLQRMWWLHTFCHLRAIALRVRWDRAVSVDHRLGCKLITWHQYGYSQPIPTIRAHTTRLHAFHCLPPPPPRPPFGAIRLAFLFAARYTSPSDRMRMCGWFIFLLLAIAFNSSNV